MITTGPSLRRAEHRRASCRPASQGDAPHRPRPEYAVALSDVDAIWRTPAGAALVESALDGQEPEDAPVVSIRGTEAVVLSGPGPRVAALVAALLDSPVPGPSFRTVRVFEREAGGWQRVRTPPPVAELPDEPPVFEDDEADLEEALAHG